jgi:nitronate monooxygenase
MSRPTLRTPLCDLLDIEFPVISAGMGPPVAGSEVDTIAGAELVAAVSNAGGLGVLGGAGFAPDQLEEEIRRIQELTDRPFGVDILAPSTGDSPLRGELPEDPRDLVSSEQREQVDDLRQELGLPESRADMSPEFLRSLTTLNPQKQVEVVIGMGVPVLAVGLGDPAPFVPAAHEAGMTVMSLVGNVRAARRVAASGADVVIAQGSEAGGHTGQIGSMALIPQVMDAVAPIPVVAAVGSGMAAALLGRSPWAALGCGVGLLSWRRTRQNWTPSASNESSMRKLSTLASLACTAARQCAISLTNSSRRGKNAGSSPLHSGCRKY